jgi:hypothetical protein
MDDVRAPLASRFMRAADFDRPISWLGDVPQVCPRLHPATTRNHTARTKLGSDRFLATTCPTFPTLLPPTVKPPRKLWGFNSLPAHQCHLSRHRHQTEPPAAGPFFVRSRFRRDW